MSVTLDPTTPAGFRAKLMRAASKVAKTVGAIAVAAGLLATQADVVAQPPPAFTNPAPADMDILLLGAEDGSALVDVKTKLDDLGWFNSVTSYDVRDNTPDLATLQQYDAVLVWSGYPYDDSTALGDALAQYHEAGGGVVCGMHETASLPGDHFYLGGSWETDGYRIITRGNWTIAGASFSLGAIEIPDHPLMEGVSSLIYGQRPVTTTLEPGSILVASSDDGHPLVAYKEKNNRHVVDLGFYPVSTDVSTSGWDSSTDGDILIGNALVFSAQPPPPPPPPPAFTNPAPADMNILLLGAENTSALVDVKTKLDDLGWFSSVTHYDVRAGSGNDVPDLAMLQQYDAVLVWSNFPYGDSTTLGDALAQYHEDGGGVVCGMFETASDLGPHRHLGGAWEIEEYRAITRGGWTSTGGPFSLAIDMPGHPLLEGVSNMVYGAHPVTTTLEPGGILVASSHDGHPLVAYKEKNNRHVVDLGFYPVSTDVNSYGWNASTDGDILIGNALIFSAQSPPPPPAFSNPAPADMDILLLGAEDGPYLADVESKLDDLGWFNSVTSYDTGDNTPDLATLQQYDAVLVWSRYPYDDSTALGNLLAQYQEAGGGVVCAMFETASVTGPHFHLGGSWETDGYRVITRGNWTIAGAPFSLGAIEIPDHPLMEGVSSLIYGQRPVTTTLEPGGILVASSHDGHPLVAYKEKNNRHVVDLGFYPVSTDVSSSGWNASTGGAILIGNALVFSAQPPAPPLPTAATDWQLFN